MRVRGQFWPNSFTALLTQLRPLLALLIIIFVFGYLNPVYFTTRNLITMSSHVSVVGILAVGMTYVILTAGIDLSVGSIAGLCGVVAGYLIAVGLGPAGAPIYLPVPLIIPLVCGFGAAVGAVNGIVISFLRIPPFIATLGMLFVARGMALLISNGSNFINLGGTAERGNTGFEIIGSDRWLGLPLQIYVMIGVAVLGSLVASRTAFGRQVYAVGGNESAARSAGINVQSVKITVYAIAGSCAALAGIILASQLAAADPSAATNYELAAIAAVVLGGTSLFGGRGTVLGSLAGSFVIVFLNDGLVITNVSEFWQMIATGLVVIGAVAIDEFQRQSGGLWRRLSRTLDSSK